MPRARTKSRPDARLETHGTIRDVPLGRMHIASRHAQREKISEARVDYLVSRFDFEQFGTPVLSERNGQFYIIDGQHRIEALKRWLKTGWETSTVPCYVYAGLTEEQEAEKFLSMNDVLPVNSFDKFRVSVSAGRADEVHIQKIVEGAGLCISKDKIPGAISCVGTLRRVYLRSNAHVLARALRITRDAFGDTAFEALVIDGLGHMAQRYDGSLDEDLAIKKLSEVRGGVKGLLNRAEVLHKQTGHAKSHCVAAAAVDIYNARKGGGRKLPSWWKLEPLAMT